MQSNRESKPGSIPWFLTKLVGGHHVEIQNQVGLKPYVVYWAFDNRADGAFEAAEQPRYTIGTLWSALSHERTKHHKKQGSIKCGLAGASPAVG